jgi:hypothetical protein
MLPLYTFASIRNGWFSLAMPPTIVGCRIDGVTQPVVCTQTTIARGSAELADRIDEYMTKILRFLAVACQE